MLTPKKSHRTFQQASHLIDVPIPATQFINNSVNCGTVRTYAHTHLAPYPLPAPTPNPHYNPTSPPSSPHKPTTHSLLATPPSQPQSIPKNPLGAPETLAYPPPPSHPHPPSNWQVPHAETQKPTNPWILRGNAASPCTYKPKYGAGHTDPRLWDTPTLAYLPRLL